MITEKGGFRGNFHVFLKLLGGSLFFDVVSMLFEWFAHIFQWFLNGVPMFFNVFLNMFSCVL